MRAAKPTNKQTIRTLAELQSGDCAEVVDVSPSEPGFVATMAARGVVPGTVISIVRTGDPLLVAVDESRWALNQIDATRISVSINGNRRSWSLRRLFRA